MNLFAIVQNGANEILYRIPLSQNLQGEISILFVELLIPYFHEKNEVAFDGNYKADEDELFVIQDFPINQDILNSSINALNYDILNIDDLAGIEGRIKAIYAIVNGDNGREVYFQYFDTRKIIAHHGISLFFNNETYNRYVNKGIVISRNLTAVLKNQNLYFKSYFNTRKIFDLSEYYQEATNQDVDTFLDNEIFEIEDAIGFREDLNSNLRKKIKSIQARGILEEITPQYLQLKATEFDLNLHFENDKLSIPRDRNYVKKLIKFLDEDYFITPLTERRCVTNSKREMN